MKTKKVALAACAALLAGGLASESALAHGGGRARLSIGLHLGAPLYVHPWHSWHGYTHVVPPPVYYPPYPPVVVQSSPPVYVERQDAPASDAGGWWYYCEATRGYYPYVKECPGGWQKVPPAPQ